MMPRLSSSTVWVLLLTLTGLAALMSYTAWTRSVELDQPSGPANHPTQAWPDMRIDLNSAAAAELSVLPGLGPMLAERIVDDRTQRGPFASVDDLDRVSGIGPAIVERLRSYAVVGSPNESAAGRPDEAIGVGNPPVDADR